MNLSTTNICQQRHTSSRVSLYLSSSVLLLLHTIDERKETTARESHGKTYLKLAQKKKENKTIIGPANFVIHLIERKRQRSQNNNNNNQIQRSLSVFLFRIFPRRGRLIDRSEDTCARWRRVVPRANPRLIDTSPFSTHSSSKICLCLNGFIVRRSEVERPSRVEHMG